jgi:hypothetical protein
MFNLYGKLETKRLGFCVLEHGGEKILSDQRGGRVRSGTHRRRGAAGSCGEGGRKRTGCQL